MNEGQVNRLHDIVVEEVSLVDRAANKHRFLIIKRDEESMGTEETTAESGESHIDQAVSGMDDAVFESAVTALEQLSDVVELLSNPESEAYEGLAELATSLRGTAEQILDHLMPHEDKPVAESESSESSGLSDKLTAIRETLNGVQDALQGQKTAPPASTPSEKPQENEGDSALSTLQTMLEGLSNTLQTLTESVKEQQARLNRVEKHFGVPNSASPEPITKAKPEENVGWPLDLNKPMDRESVDKSVSFHEV